LHAHQATLALLRLKGQQHVALSSDRRYIQEVLDRVLPRLLPSTTAQFSSVYLIVRELLASVTLRPILEEVTAPQFVNTLIVDLLEPSRPPPPPLDNAAKTIVPLLLSVQPPQNSASAFQTSLAAILSDPSGLLAPFQQYLVEVGRIDEFMCYRELDELILEYADASVTMTDMKRRQEYNKAARRIYDTLIDPKRQVRTHDALAILSNPAHPLLSLSLSLSRTHPTVLLLLCAVCARIRASAARGGMCMLQLIIAGY
jgi:hypothetical protein